MSKPATSGGSAAPMIASVVLIILFGAKVPAATVAAGTAAAKAVGA